MANSKIGLADNLQTAIGEILKNVQNVTQDVVDSAAQKVSKKCAKEINERAYGYGWTGGHAGSWRVTRNKNARLSTTYIVHSNDYQIAHLLEHGHVLPNNAQAYEYIKPAEDNAIWEFPKLLDEEIEKKLEEEKYDIRIKLGGNK